MSIRSGGFAPIESYAALGDGRTVALVARDGRIDWYALPTLDAPPVFAAVLDPNHGGEIALAPDGRYEVERSYLDGTNVLQTTFRTPDGVVRVTDVLAVGSAGPLPWGELTRRVECLAGEVSLSWSVRPGTRFGRARPWVTRRFGVPVLTLEDQHVAVLAFDLGDVQTDHHRVHAGVRLRAGDIGLLALVSTDREPIRLPGRQELERRLDGTVREWSEWVSRLEYDGPWRDEVVRSALTLKLLIFAPTGAIAAAPTTSLPEQVGGSRNWDYRYSWIRDSSFTIDALIRLGMHEEVHAALSWLLDTIAETAPQLHVFYGLDGQVTEGESEVPMRGYRGSQPVRSGNGAADQLQLGNFGDLLESVWLYVEQGNAIDESTTSTLAAIGDRVCHVWRSPDAGIWELPQQRHYTISKMACWVALDRLVRLAECDQIASPHVDRWRAERDEVHAWVEQHCWSDRKGSYTFYAGGDDLDASVLLAARTGFADPAGDRMATTIEALRRELGEGPLLYRYTGMREQEGAFVACSFWLVDALARAGRDEEARTLMAELLDRANDVGLFAEEIDPATGSMLGNFPQGLSHLALVTAAASVQRNAGG